MAGRQGGRPGQRLRKDTTVTHRKRTRFLALAGAVLGAAALTASMATAASASPRTDPSPSPTETVSAPAPLRALHLRPETFIIHSSTANPAGDGVFRGPVRGASVGNFANGVDLESLTGPTGTVRLVHTPVGPLVIDWGTCTASLHQVGRWALFGRSGADRRAFGFGTYTLDADAILAR